MIKYKIKSAEIEFDNNGNLSSITTIAAMPCNDLDVRKIQARGTHPYWKARFSSYNEKLQEILQFVTANGSEIEFN